MGSREWWILLMGTFLGVIVAIPLSVFLYGAGIPYRIENLLFRRRGRGSYTPGMPGPWWLGGWPRED